MKQDSDAFIYPIGVPEICENMASGSDSFGWRVSKADVILIIIFVAVTVFLVINYAIVAYHQSLGS
jgi:hypothetical protein